MFKIVHEDQRHTMPTVPGLPIELILPIAGAPHTLAIIVSHSEPLLRPATLGNIYVMMIDTMIVTAVRSCEKLGSDGLTVTYDIMQCTCDGEWHAKWHVDVKRVVHKIAVIDYKYLPHLAKK